MNEAACPRCGRALDPASVGPLCDACTTQLSQHSPAPSDVAPGPVRGPLFRPVATYTLVGLNVLVYVLMVLTGASATDPNREQLLRWGADFGPLTLTSQPWRMVTAAFVHIGAMHIFFNMWCLVSLGALAEAIYKRTTYVLIYLLSGITGSITSLVVYPLTTSAGASGAIFGIVGALIAAFKLGRLRIPPPVVKKQLTNLFVFAGFNLIYGAVMPGVNNAAHLGGLAGGLFMGAIIAIAIRRHSDFRRARNLAIGLTVVIVIAGYLGVRKAHAFTVDLFEGHQALATGNFRAARDRLQLATKERPNDARAFGDLGAAYMRLGDIPSAEAAWRHCVELNPRDATARYQLASTYYTEHKYADAAATMKQVVDMQPSDPEAREFFAQILDAQGDRAAAAQQHQRALQLRTGNQDQGDKGQSR